ncbi:cysteine peptidase family C39 domain-containing protein [uncultured Chryseobacterium sp.]|uniref:cysteine peptidase family C39 domain-containing protein n=1 Tax=uncultured Chryseobacterium sp. TaxID=259322 RepID=UPI0025CCDC95|nr:cysteine peptidase family C39 domain-containing protein [uncultured Chryseobacterium sp.]
MENFDDEFGDLSQFKTVIFEEMNKGLIGNKSALGDTIINRDDFPEYRSPFHNYRNTPLGYSYLTDNPVSSIFPSTGIDKNGKKGYEYRAEVLPCENGSQVLGSYNANKREPQSLFLFYEKPNPNKSNFAGDFYTVKMGDYFVTLFKRFPEPLPSNVGGKFFKNITSMEDEAAYLAQLAYTYEGDKINATLVRDALMREYQFYTGDRRFEEIIGNITSIPADALGWCAENLEDFKPTEKNYNPEAKDYSPLVPIVIGGVAVPIPINMNKASQFFENLGNNPFVQGADVAFTQVWELVKRAASKVKDASIAHLPDAFKGLVEKISSIINTIKNFLNEVKEELVELAKIGVEILKLANAFYCGINSGLVGLLQCILYILQALFQPTTAFSYEQYKERRDLLEKAEDVLDWILANTPVFFKGVKDLFSSSGGISQSDFEGIFDKLKKYWDNTSRYTVAFYVGIIAFEFIINILLLIFTAGSGNIIKGTTYAQKATSLLKLITREAMSAITFGITDLLTLLGKLIFRFGKACAKGFKGFIKFIEELLQGAKNGAKAEDLAMTAEEIEEVVLKGKKAKSIYSILVSARIGFKKLGIEILAKADGYLLKWKEKPIFKGDFKEVNAFWNKILKSRIGTGTGGVLKYLEVLSRNMVAQEHNMSCAAACIRQLAKDHGIELTEKVIREFARTTEEMGTFPDGILDGLKKVFKDKKILDRTFIRNPDHLMPLILEDISKEGSWIGIVLPENGNYHVVIVDKIVDGKVFVRDPWPPEGIGKGKGVEAVIGLDEFADSWLRCGAYSYHVK